MLELDGRTLTYEQFRDSCLKTNLPAIIRHAAVECNDGVTQSFFSLEHIRARLSPKGLVYAYGWSHHVPTVELVTDSVSGGGGGCTYMEFKRRSLEEVMECWRDGEKVLYLKDWHMQMDSEACAKTMKSINVVDNIEFDEYGDIVHGDSLYRVPDYLGDDWMNEFCRRARNNGESDCYFGDQTSDYRFAYIGPPSTWTPLHFDVFGTYSWSLNVCGDKLWFFTSPEGNRKLMENSLQGVMLPVDIRTTTDVELWTIVQHPGDLVFVPSGYLHQVHNVSGPHFVLPRKDVKLTGNAVDEVDEDYVLGAGMNTVSLVISINHNWCNEWCVEKMVEAFCRDAHRMGRLFTKEDRLALFGEDITAWRNHVERMLFSGTNWNFASIRSFLNYRLTRVNVHNDDTKEGATLRHLLEKIAAVELCTTQCLGT